MGVDTHLYLNTRWDLNDIIKVIERTQNKKVEVKAHEGMILGYFDFNVGERRIFVHLNSQTPIGSATYLSLHADEEAHKILKDIADVLGGILEYFDSDGKCEMIDGSLWEEDGLPYFLKHAIIEDGIDNHDLPALKQSISNWYDQCDKSRKPDYLK